MNKEKYNKELITKSTTSEVKSILTDISEQSLDSILDNEILKELPIIKWLIAGKNIGSSIQNRFFLKKYISFIGYISKDNINWNKNLEKEDVSRIIEFTIIYIDRYQTEFKAKLLAELFIQTFEKKIFTIDEYNSLLHSIDMIHPFNGFELLKEFYNYRIESDQQEENFVSKIEIWKKYCDLDYSILSTSGLLKLPQGGSSAGNLGGAWLNDLGKKFYENVVLNCINKNEN